VLELFVEERCFDGKGFKMIAHINQHFNLSGVVDSLAYIFDLINIKQLDQESLVTFKARFSCLFTALKMGGISINSALQVGFMLRALLSKYQAVVHEFWLGCHALTEASLQTSVEQCTNYDKDPWKGPVGKDGKPAHTHSTNAAVADSDNPYDALAAKSFNYHFGCWKKFFVDQKGKYMMCFDTARNPNHKTCNCPILKKLGFILVKWTAANNAPQDAASQVATDATTPAPAATPSSASIPSSDKQSCCSASIPGAFSALADQASYDSSDEFDYGGETEGTMYIGNSNSNASYNYLHASCRNVTVEPTSSTNSSPIHNLGCVSTTASGKLKKGSTASHTATDP
jgi:hypothetical protein